MKKLFSNKIKPRIYVYSNSGKYKVRIDGIRIRMYKDERARRPYFIYRIADVKIVKTWKNIVQDFSLKRLNYADILRGFFAGEGNLKEGSHCNRAIRIAQKQRKEFIDIILDFFKIKYKFSPDERAYVICNRENWEKLAKIKIADLHSEKKKRFWRIYKEFKEFHYSHNYIKNNIISQLSSPKTSRELAIVFNRGQSRIQRVLSKLKEEGKVSNYRVYSKDFWVRKDAGVILISGVKQKYLKILNRPQTTKNISTRLGVCPRSSQGRLRELEKLGLVRRKDYLWYQIPTNKEVKAL